MAETERRKRIFAMRAEFDTYLLIVDLLLEVETYALISRSREKLIQRDSLIGKIPKKYDNEIYTIKMHSNYDLLKYII